jgi:hypothetical protein
MMLPLPELTEIIAVVPMCACERPRARMNGCCRTCGGAIEWPTPDDLPHRELWWPFTDEENER